MVPVRSPATLLWNMQSSCYGTCLAYRLLSFCLAAGSTLLVAAKTYVCSTESFACISARLCNLLKSKDGHISPCTDPCNCCAYQVGQGAKPFGKSITLVFNAPSTASVVIIACFSYSCYIYRGHFNQGYCYCVWLDNL